MKNLLSFMLFSLVLSSNVSAASFKKIHTLKNPALNALAQEIFRILMDEELKDVVSAAGNVNEVSTYSFVRSTTEMDINTVKQFNIKYHNQLPNDEMGTTAEEITSGYGKDVIDSLFFEIQWDNYNDNQLKCLKKAYHDLLVALLNRTNKLKNPDFKYFKADHAYEDGSWGIVNILDTKNNEILSFVLGVSGT